MESRTSGGYEVVCIAKFRGLYKHTFYLHVKKCEFRYSCINQNLYLTLLKGLRKDKLD